MRLADFEAFSFDCYGTLIDWETGIASVLRPWAQRCGLRLDDEELLTSYAGHEAAAEAAHPAEAYPDILRRSMTALGAELGAAVTEADAHALAGSVPDWPAFPDSPAALGRLQRHGRLIILSNVDRSSFAASNARLGVDFDRVLTAQDIGSYKPDPRNFAVLRSEARSMGVPEGRLLHVAQSLFHDHVPARRAGLPTVWIDRRRGRPGWGATPPPPAQVQPDWTFRSMAEFADAVDRAYQAGSL